MFNWNVHFIQLWIMFAQIANNFFSFQIQICQLFFVNWCQIFHFSDFSWILFAIQTSKMARGRKTSKTTSKSVAKAPRKKSPEKENTPDNSQHSSPENSPVKPKAETPRKSRRNSRAQRDDSVASTRENSPASSRENSPAPPNDQSSQMVDDSAKKSVKRGRGRKRSSQRAKKRSSDRVNMSNGEKKRKKRTFSSFKYFINNVLKEVHRDRGITSRAMTIMNDLMVHTFERLASEAAHLVKVNKKKVLSSREIQTAVRFVFPGELARHAVKEGTKAVTKYHASQP